MSSTINSDFRIWGLSRGRMAAYFGRRIFWRCRILCLGESWTSVAVATQEQSCLIFCEMVLCIVHDPSLGRLRRLRAIGCDKNCDHRFWYINDGPVIRGDILPLCLEL